MPEITVTNQVVVDGHHITADLVIAPTATGGAKTLHVTTPGGGTTRAFTVTALDAPVITAVSPATGPSSATTPIILTGSGFRPGLSIAVSGAGVTVQNIVRLGDGLVTADLVIAAGAAAGARTIQVTTDVGVSNPGAFTVGIPTAGLLVWMDADDGIGVYTDDQIITGFTNRGSAGAFAVASGLAGPNWKSGLFGGKPCLDFRGAQAIETPAASVTMTSYAIFIVGFLSSSTTIHCPYQFTDGVASTWLMAFVNPVITTIKPAGTSSYGVGSSPITRDLRKLWRHRFVDTHASHQLWQNGVQLAVANDGTTGNPGGAASLAGQLRIGANSAGGTRMVGYVRRFLAYSPCPSDAEIAVIEASLTAEGSLQ